jgi:hypothetical protein
MPWPEIGATHTATGKPVATLFWIEIKTAVSMRQITLVFHLAWYTSRGLPPQIQWRSFRDGDQIEFLANGMTNWQNGRFIMYSPTHRIPAKHLIINAAGRSYIREVPSPDCG